MISKLLSVSSWYMYNVSLAEALSPYAAIVLSCLCDQHEYYKANALLSASGYFYCTTQVMTNKTAISGRPLTAAIDLVIDAGLFERKLMGSPATMHYRICPDFDQKIADLTNSVYANCANKFTQTAQTSLGEMRKQVYANCVTNHTILSNQVSNQIKEEEAATSVSLKTKKKTVKAARTLKPKVDDSEPLVDYFDLGLDLAKMTNTQASDLQLSCADWVGRLADAGVVIPPFDFCKRAVLLVASWIADKKVRTSVLVQLPKWGFDSAFDKLLHQSKSKLNPTQSKNGTNKFSAANFFASTNG